MVAQKVTPTTVHYLYGGDDQNVVFTKCFQLRSAQKLREVWLRSHFLIDMMTIFLTTNACMTTLLCGLKGGGFQRPFDLCFPERPRRRMKLADLLSRPQWLSSISNWEQRGGDAIHFRSRLDNKQNETGRGLSGIATQNELSSQDHNSESCNFQIMHFQRCHP